MFFDFVNGLCYRTVRALFMQAAETGKDSIDEELLLLFDLFDFFCLFTRHFYPSKKLPQIVHQRDQRSDDSRSGD